VLNGLTFLHRLHSVLLGFSFEWLGPDNSRLNQVG
jgi:hypothetical protein